MISRHVQRTASCVTTRLTYLATSSQNNWTGGSAVVGVKRKFGTQFKAKLNENVVEAKTDSQELQNARPFEEIPGLGKLGFVFAFMPGGPCFKGTMEDLNEYMFKKFGNLYRIPGIFGNPPLLICRNPNDFPIVFRYEGIWPYRRTFDSLSYYREVYRKDFFQGVEGIVATNGEKWATARTAVNPVLMQPKNAVLYLDTLLDVNDEFLLRIREIRDAKTNEMPDTFEDDINRLTFESVAAVALNTQLGMIRKNRDSEEAKTMLHCLRRVFDLCFKLDIMPSLWKFIPTPAFKEQMRNMDSIINVCNKYITAALDKIDHDVDFKLTTKADNEKSVLEKLLRIDKKLAVVMALDLMLAGVDTTSTTLTGILLCIAKNTDKQKKLYEEIKTILPEKNSRLTIEKMRNLPYLRACIKEGIRLYPIIPGTVRRMPVDVVLSGYRVPAGTEVAVAANLELKNEKYVPRAKEFLPERWLRTTEGGDSSLTGQIENPFMYVPFGFGPRSCAGKRIVNMELEITIARLVRNFTIEFNYPIDKAFTNKFINVPNIPLKFKFEERLE